MRTLFAATLGAALLALTAGGCGTITMVTDDGGDSGDAGSKGQAGSTGAGGRGGAGPAGASGQAGSSGVAGATGVAGSNTGVAGRGGATGVAGSSTGVAGSNTGVAGRGGSTGVAGASTGVAGSGAAGRGGATGVAGSGTGQAGSAGPGGSGGQGVPAAACPFKVPPEGAGCSNEGLACEYGTDPRGDRCRTILVCSSQQWKLTNKPDSRDCPAIEYPPCNGKPGEVCDPAGGYCYQSDGAACSCATCPGNMICLPGTKPHLYCTMPSSQGCPAAEPNMGTPCEIEKLECLYCPDLPRICVKGIWTPGDRPCPVAAN